jgi:anti-sigma factor RsiW
MKHPSQETLALHAGGDLGMFARWRTGRHLANCDRCRTEVAAFEDLRDELPGLADIPEIDWDQMAAELKANIRLGLEAGECVRSGSAQALKPLRDARWFTGVRAAVALASIATLVVTGVVLENASPQREAAARDTRQVIENTAEGIQIGSGDQAFRLMYTGAKDVSVTVGTDSMGARYVDPHTGYVQVSRVYAE